MDGIRSLCNDLRIFNVRYTFLVPRTVDVVTRLGLARAWSLIKSQSFSVPSTLFFLQQAIASSADHHLSLFQRQRILLIPEVILSAFLYLLLLGIRIVKPRRCELQSSCSMATSFLFIIPLY